MIPTGYPSSLVANCGPCGDVLPNVIDTLAFFAAHLDYRQFTRHFKTIDSQAGLESAGPQFGL
jgi:hypothetical protein